MSERFVKYFWDTITFCGAVSPDKEYIYFGHLKDSPETKDVIFPFLLSEENANARRACDVVKTYFPHIGEIEDVVRIVNHGYFSLYGFQSSGEKTLILGAPLFAIPTIPSFACSTVQQDPKYRRPYKDIEMQQIYDYFTVVLTFPEGVQLLTYPVKMTIITEGITKYLELVFKALVIEQDH
jgi:hypothetical protein